ncbi:MAG: hypothetical protein AAB279_07240 [Candidatus Binatota bacterium]
MFGRGREGGLSLLYGHPKVNSLAQRLLARPLSQGYGVTVLDAGNLFDPYLISRMAQALGREPREFLSKILISRSFTCHKTHALVSKVASLHQQPSRIILVLGCLTTFYDEEISLGERATLLKKTLALLRESSQRGAGVFVTSTDSPADLRCGFAKLLVHTADRAARLDLRQDGSFRINLIKGIDAAGSLKS